MKSELDKKLCEKYPKLFAQRHKSPQETCMCWGFECGDGWYDLIDSLCDMLQFDIDRNRHDQIEVVQVKEKFGTLRFYTSGADERQQGMIDFAEFLSGSICENCGAWGGKERGGGWIQTLCDKCYNEK